MPYQQDTSALLLCDPLTGLVAYPSFEELLIAGLPALAIKGLHLAIGDVDDLETMLARPGEAIRRNSAISPGTSACGESAWLPVNGRQIGSMVGHSQSAPRSAAMK